MEDPESLAERAIDFVGEKGDLSFVIFAVIEKPIAANPMAGDAFNRVDFLRRIFVRRAAVMTEKIMRGRNVEVQNLHPTAYHAP